MTQTLIDKGFAYVAGNGDVMYAVRKFPDYGRLSGKKIDDLRAGARVQIDESKLDPLDSCFGSTRSRASRRGSPRGGADAPDGTSSAPRCRRVCSAAISICTAAAWI